MDLRASPAQASCEGSVGSEAPTAEAHFRNLFRAIDPPLNARDHGSRVFEDIGNPPVGWTSG